MTIDRRYTWAAQRTSYRRVSRRERPYRRRSHLGGTQELLPRARPKTSSLQCREIAAPLHAVARSLSPRCCTPSLRERRGFGDTPLRRVARFPPRAVLRLMKIFRGYHPQSLKKAQDHHVLAAGLGAGLGLCRKNLRVYSPFPEVVRLLEGPLIRIRHGRITGHPGRAPAAPSRVLRGRPGPLRGTRRVLPRRAGRCRRYDKSVVDRPTSYDKSQFRC